MVRRQGWQGWLGRDATGRQNRVGKPSEVRMQTCFRSKGAFDNDEAMQFVFVPQPPHPSRRWFPSSSQGIADVGGDVHRGGEGAPGPEEEEEGEPESGYQVPMDLMQALVVRLKRMSSSRLTAVEDWCDGIMLEVDSQFPVQLPCWYENLVVGVYRMLSTIHGSTTTMLRPPMRAGPDM